MIAHQDSSQRRAASPAHFDNHSFDGSDPISRGSSKFSEIKHSGKLGQQADDSDYKQIDIYFLRDNAICLSVLKNLEQQNARAALAQLRRKGRPKTPPVLGSK
jgi:hypothetical protein